MTKLAKKKDFYFFIVQKGATNATIFKNITIAHQELQATLFAKELSFTAQETEQNES